MAEPPSSLSRVELYAGGVTIIGAPPGAGKTALVMQFLFDQAARDETFRALVCNVEMPPRDLLDRQLARLAGVPYGKVRNRDWRPADDRDIDAATEIERVIPQIRIIAPPFTIERVKAQADAHRADVVLVDYLQRLESDKQAQDQKQHLTHLMNECRLLAMAGRAVIAISAVSRQSYQAAQGSNQLAAFRESSEIEFGADVAYILAPAEGEDGSTPGTVRMTFNCVKNRGGSRDPIDCKFFGTYMRFSGEPELTEGAEWEEWQP